MRRQGLFPGVVGSGAIALVLCGVVGATARGAPVWAPMREGRVDPVEVMVNVAGAGSLAIAAALGAAWVVHRAFLNRRAGAQPLQRTLLDALPAMTVVFAAVALLAIAGTDPDGRSQNPLEVDLPGVPREGGTIVDSREGLLEGEDRRPEEEADGGDEGASGVALLLWLGAAVAALFAVWLWSARKRRSALAEELTGEGEAGQEPDVEVVRGAVAHGIDAMLLDRDPQKAIIAAYARLLEGLAASGAGRRSHEGPLEHVHRVLTRLKVRPEPLRQLIDLFAVARFSSHTLTAADREDALNALKAAAADLERDVAKRGGGVAAAGGRR